MKAASPLTRFVLLSLGLTFGLSLGLSACAGDDPESCVAYEEAVLDDASVCDEPYVRTICLDGAHPNLTSACAPKRADNQPGDPNKDEGPNHEGEDSTSCTGEVERNIACGLNHRGIARQICVGGAFIDDERGCEDLDICIDATEEEQDCQYNSEPGTQKRACTVGEWPEFSTCHVCTQGEIVDCDVESHLVTPRRLCHANNGYNACTAVNQQTDIEGVRYYHASAHLNDRSVSITSFTPGFSISYWLLVSSGTPDGIFQLGTDDIPNIFSLGIDGIFCGDDELDLCGGGTYAIGGGFAEAITTLGERNHIAVTMSETEFRIYLNGVEITDITPPEDGTFHFPGLSAGVYKFLYTPGPTFTVYHTTVVTDILSPEDVALLYAKMGN